MPTAAFHTVGCKLNHYETEAIREQFEVNGYDVVPFRTVADVYVINTCAVTAKSDRTSRQAVYQALRRAPGARVVATGCSVQISPQTFAHIPGVEVVVGTEGKENVFDHVSERGSGKPMGTPPVHEHPSGWFSISHFRDCTRAFIKIQDGCNASCSYCIVPLTRGAHRSRPLRSIVSQAHRLVESGYKEIVVTGVHLGMYGVDLPEKPSLVDVLKALVDIHGLSRLRLSSVEPTECSPSLIDLIASSPKICRHMHIPLQSGDDEILTQMKRHYSARDVARLIETLVTRIPDVGIGTDVIVGFPGETDRHFERSYALVEELPFSYLHVFSYSRRPGTAAASYPDQVPAGVRKVRSARFRELRARKMKEFGSRFVGRPLDVLLEHRRDRQSGLLTGLSDNYIRLRVAGPDDLQGEEVRVRVLSVGGGYATGSLIEVM